MTERSGPSGGDIFIELILAAMKDAVSERKLSQFKATITPPGRTTPQFVRIIIVPETMDIEWSEPLGSK